jgi:hypothetical protein
MIRINEPVKLRRILVDLNVSYGNCRIQFAVSTAKVMRKEED